jgi:hypothetical protein
VRENRESGNQYPGVRIQNPAFRSENPREKWRYRLVLSTQFCVLASLLLLSCAPTAIIHQFYPDTFYPQDRMYQNRSLGFALVYKPTWVLLPDPADMSKSQRAAATALRAQAAELLYAGQTADGSQGTRAIVENLNQSNEEFLVALRDANRGMVIEDHGQTTFMAGNRLALKWEYSAGQFRYAEFLFRIGTFNIRIAFWTVPERYDEFLPVYEDIMSTLSTAAGI